MPSSLTMLHCLRLQQPGRQYSDSKVHMQDAAQLKQFLQCNQPMLLVSCNNRAEKSLFLSNLISHCDPQKIFFRLKGRLNLHPTLLTELFSKHWAVNSHAANRKKTGISFDHIFASLKTHGQHCLLIVERAHLLPISILEMLCRLADHQTINGTHIQIILLGHPEIIPTINKLYLGNINIPAILQLSSAKKIKPPLYFPTSIAAQRSFPITLFILFASGFLWWKTQASGVSSFSIEKSIPIYYNH